MYPVLIGIAIVACIAALAGTLVVARTESNKIKQYETSGDSSSAELQRSVEYESKSVKENIPILAVIYGLTFLASLIIILIILFG